MCNLGEAISFWPLCIELGSLDPCKTQVNYFYETNHPNTVVKIIIFGVLGDRKPNSLLQLLTYLTGRHQSHMTNGEYTGKDEEPSHKELTQLSKVTFTTRSKAIIKDLCKMYF